MLLRQACAMCRIHPRHFPSSLECVKLDLWRYEGADVRALGQLPNLRSLVFHFLPVSSELPYPC